MSILDPIKRHPYLAGGTALVAVLFIMLHRQPAATSTSAADPNASDVTAANNWQMLQAQMQAHAADTQAQVQAQAEHDAAAISLATIQAHTADNANTLAQQLGLAQLNTQQAIATSTLDAQKEVQLKGMDIQAATNASMIDLLKTQAANSEREYMETMFIRANQGQRI